MPRNRNKTRCAVPECRNWAMRDHTCCRSHRDSELGERGGGAPPRNLHALKTGAHANPLPPSEFADLVAAIVAAPDDLPFQIGLVVRDIQGHTGDPFLALVALRRLFIQLVPLVAARLFTAELRDALRSTPLTPHECDEYIRKIERLATGKNMEAHLWSLRKKRFSR